MRRPDNGNGEAAPGRRARLAKRASFVSLLILSASLGALLVLVLDRSMNGEEPTLQPAASTATATATEAPTTPTATSPSTPASRETTTATATAATMPAKVLYWGDLPPELASPNLQPASEATDLAFLRDSGEAYRIVSRYYVPVAAIGAGVDALTLTQMEDLRRGAITDWAEVGGIPGPVRAFAVAPGAGDEAMTAFAPVTPEQTFATYEELLDAMTLDSGAWAILPIEEVGPTVTAVAVSGIDLVRGRGDASEWPFVEAVTLVAFTEEGRLAAEALVAEHSAPLPEAVTVIATGDILQSRCSLTRIRATGDWGAALRGPVGEYLASADLTLGSVDGSIQDIAEPLGLLPARQPEARRQR